MQQLKRSCFIVLLSQFFMRLKADPERLLTSLVPGKTRYNFAQMISSEKKNFSRLGKFFNRLIMSNISIELFIKCVFTNIKLC